MTLRARLNIPAPVDEDEFEDKVEDALRLRHSNASLKRFGRKGQRQDGIDGFDPLSRAPDGIVWQSTLQQTALVAKLQSDLAKMDKAGIKPLRVIYAVGIMRDGPLQQSVSCISSARMAVAKCPVELLFWDDIRGIILGDDGLYKKWYPDLAIQQPGSVSRGTVDRFRADNQIPAGDEDSHPVRLWHMVQLSGINADGLSQPERDEIQGAAEVAKAGLAGFKYWSNGQTACIGSRWYYPNGQTACIGSRWYYPNGQTANIGSRWYYPNGQTANIGSRWYYPNGQTAGGEASLLAACYGALSPPERAAVISRLGGASGNERQLIVVGLAWTSRRP